MLPMLSSAIRCHAQQREPKIEQ